MGKYTKLKYICKVGTQLSVHVTHFTKSCPKNNTNPHTTDQRISVLCTVLCVYKWHYFAVYSSGMVQSVV